MMDDNIRKGVYVYGSLWGIADIGTALLINYTLIFEMLFLKKKKYFFFMRLRDPGSHYFVMPQSLHVAYKDTTADGQKDGLRHSF